MNEELDKIRVKLDKRQLQNLLLFLDRVEYKGLKEVEAINEIIELLNKASKEGE